MSTNAQILANQQNALLSTGPKTPEGKAASAKNATKHGLTASFSVLLHESQDDFDQLLATYRDEFSPDGEHENFLVDQMAQSRWKLNRIQRLENVAFDQILNEANPGDPDAQMVAALSTTGNVFDRLQRYAAAAERSYHRAHSELLRAQAAERKAKDHDLETYIKETIFAPLPGQPPRQSTLRNKPNPSPVTAESLAARLGQDKPIHDRTA